MNKYKLAEQIDMTLLSPTITVAELEGALLRIPAYPFASVCVPPCYVSRVFSILRNHALNVSTVVGFPFGYESTELKLSQGAAAVYEGAAEIDMVMNISALKSGDFSGVEEDISSIVSALPGTAVKVIIECCYLTTEEKIAATEIVVRAGAAFVKTSTGFGESGATVEDVKLLKKIAAGRIKVKAAGGIKTLGDALLMIEAGADRIGTSAGLSLMEASK